MSENQPVRSEGFFKRLQRRFSFAEPIASVGQIQNTGKPTTRTKRSDYAREIGASGTSLIDGFIEEEYNSDLTGEKGYEVFERMRRGDSQIAAILDAIMLPIKSTRRYVEPGADSEGEIDDTAREIQELVETALFDKLDNTWIQTLHEILSMLPFGFSVFEKVYTIEDGVIFLKKLGFRKQNSIHRRTTADGAAGITQVLPQPIQNSENPNKGQNLVSIPSDKLLIFSHNKEGDNYAGVSILRPAYKDRYMKDNLIKFNAVRHERQSVGIPVMNVPSNASAEERSAAQDIVENVRSTEQTGIVMPGSETEGYKFEFADTKAGQSTNLLESIKFHNREISKCVLAQFIELGDTASGSRALSEDQSDFFILSLNAIAQHIADVINRYLIPELVSMNYDTKIFPKLRFDKVGEKDLEKFASTLSMFISAGVIEVDEGIQDMIRELMQLPAREKDAMTEEEELPEEPEVDEDGNPIEPEIDPEDDGGDDTDDTSEDDELDALQSEIDSLSASEEEDSSNFDDIFYEGIYAAEAAIENMFAVVDQATKDKISEGLKAYRAKQGGRDLKQTKAQLTKNVKETSSIIDKADSDFKQKTAGLRGEIDKLKAAKDAIASGKATVAQRKQLAKSLKDLNAKVKAMRKERDAAIKPQKEARSIAVKNRKQVNELIKQRKTAIAAQVKKIQSEVKAGRMDAKKAVKPLQDKISGNIQQMSALRKQLKDAPKEKKDALRAMINGLIEENSSVRGAVKNISGSAKAAADSKRAEAEKTKKESGLYHEHSHEDLPGEFDDYYFRELSGMINNKTIIELQKEVAEEHAAALKKKGFRFSEFEDKARRPLTFAERKVNFTSLKRSLETFSNILAEKIDEITARQKADLLSQVKKAVEANDIEAVGAIAAKYSNDISQAITDVQKELFEIGKKSAAVEMAVSVPATKKEVKGALRLQNDNIVQRVVGDLDSKTKTAVSGVIAKRAGSITATQATEAVSAASAVIDDVLTKAKAAVTSLAVIASVNMGRASIFESYPEQVYAMQFSAILDDRTTELCRSLDGRVVKPGSDDFYKFSPPLHFNCRSIRVEILQDEEFKPEIKGIPGGINAPASLDSFKDLKAPVVDKNSPAIKLVKGELDDLKKKLKDLETKNMNTYRQNQYKTRIAELEKSLAQAYCDPIKEILKADGIEFKEENQ